MMIECKVTQIVSRFSSIIMIFTQGGKYRILYFPPGTETEKIIISSGGFVTQVNNLTVNSILLSLSSNNFKGLNFKLTELTMRNFHSRAVCKKTAILW